MIHFETNPGPLPMDDDDPDPAPGLLGTLVRILRG